MDNKSNMQSLDFYSSIMIYYRPHISQLQHQYKRIHIQREVTISIQFMQQHTCTCEIHVVIKNLFIHFIKQLQIFLWKKSELSFFKLLPLHYWPMLPKISSLSRSWMQISQQIFITSQAEWLMHVVFCSCFQNDSFSLVMSLIVNTL